MPYVVVILLLIIACLGTLSPLAGAYGDYDDSADDFWRDAPSPSGKKLKEKIDPATGQRLVGTTIRFFQARLKPDRQRTRESTAELAASLNEIFFQAGMSHNQASPAGTHVITIQTRDEWDEVKEAIFALPDVYDVTVREDVHLRPSETVPYSELWKAEMGDSVPEPLKSSLKAPPPPSEAAAGKSNGEAAGGAKKKRKGKKRRSAHADGASGEL